MTPRSFKPWMLLALLLSSMGTTLGACSSGSPGDGGTDVLNDTATTDTAVMDVVATDVSRTDVPQDNNSTDAVAQDSAPDGGAITPECETYCTCYLANCAAMQPIPTGMSCGAFCATFTSQQRQCRQDHCRLVPFEGAHHCPHAVGIDQCM